MRGGRNVKKRLALNTMSSLLLQGCTIICGFILPRLILSNFGSTTNGLVNSISQFLGIITFLELGVGTVVQSALYKPLAENDSVEISKVISSANKFFRRIASILLVYVIILCIVYPYISAKGNENRFEIVLLIIAMSVSSFAQYYFGIVDKLLLNADQHGYIQYIIQIICLIISTIVSVIIINMGASIQLVKFSSSIIFLVQPFVIHIYVNKRYKVDKHIKYETEPIRQKWNGIAQHVSAIVLDGTDNIILTIFSTLENVSIYAVYNMVLSGLKVLIVSLTNGIQPLLGELRAKKEVEQLKSLFGRLEWSVHSLVTFVFTTAGVLIVPFVKVYTNGIIDADYIQPVFSLLLTLAMAGYCLRLPYLMVVFAYGHYKQTQNSFIIAAIMNIVVSILTVYKWGLIGVAIGTVISVFYQTIWMAIYNYKELLNCPIKATLKQVITDAVIALLCYIISHFFILGDTTYIEWIFLAIKVGGTVLLVMLIVNLIVYHRNLVWVLSKIRRSK